MFLHATNIKIEYIDIISNATMSQLFDIILTANDCNVNDTTKYSLLDACCCRYPCKTIGSYREDYEILEECKKEAIMYVNMKKYGIDGPYQLHLLQHEKEIQKHKETEDKKTLEEKEKEDEIQILLGEQEIKDNETQENKGYADSNDYETKEKSDNESIVSEISITDRQIAIKKKRKYILKPIYINFDEYLDMCQEKLDKIFNNKISDKALSKTAKKYITKYFDNKIKDRIKQYFQSYYSHGSDINIKLALEQLFNEYFNISYSDFSNPSSKHIFKRNDGKLFRFDGKKFIEHIDRDDGKCDFCPHIIDFIRMRNMERIIINTLSQSISNENKYNIFINLLYVMQMTCDRWKFYIQLPNLPVYEVLDHKIREKRVCAKTTWVSSMIIIIIIIIVGSLIAIINTIKN
jgi:hypothetical protein